jgi:signal peptidase I
VRPWLKANRGFILFLLGLAFFRTAVADWNPIPSGSMRPTILEGDVVFVDRLAYDFKFPLTDLSLARIGEPRRGDIVTFRSPKDGTRLIKRIVGVPGDVVEMRDDVLLVNGRAAIYLPVSSGRESLGYGLEVDSTRAIETGAGRQHAVQFLADVAARRSFAPLVVPADRYFMLGDNRDNSEDSRYIGTVPRQLLIGRAQRILVSADILGHWSPRVQRTAQRLE